MTFDYKRNKPPLITAMSVPSNIQPSQHFTDKFRGFNHEHFGSGISHYSTSGDSGSSSSSRRRRRRDEPLYKSSPTNNRLARTTHSKQESFLLRLMAIDDKHDRHRASKDKMKDKYVDQAGVVYRPTGVTPGGGGGGGVVTESFFHWAPGQMLDDGLEPNLSPETLTSKTSRELRLPHVMTSGTANFTGHFHGQAMQDRQLGHSFDANAPNETPDASNPSQPESVRRKSLRLPPLLLPPVYTVRPRPLKQREFLAPTQTRGPISETEWDDLLQCRYLRHNAADLQLSPPSSPFQC